MTDEPNNKIGKLHRPPLREDHERREAFLAELRTGTCGAIEAARRVSPHCSSRQGAYSAFANLRKADPRFAKEWDAALQEGRDMLLSELEETAIRWVREPPRKPVYEDGKLAGWVEDRNSASKVLLRYLSRLSTEWSERRSVEHAGQVDHRHAHLHLTGNPDAISIDARDLELLGDEKAQQLLDLVEELRQRVDSQQTDESPTPLLEGNVDG